MAGMSDAAAGDKSVLDHIHDLVAEEKALRASHGGGLGDAERARLKELEGQLDQAWDLLRQRRAHEEFHEDPDASAERPVDNVTKYLQ